MAKDKKVEQITDMEVDFAQWFTDVCKKAQLIDYSSIKGMFIYRPYGYAIWENIQRIMDAEFKKTGAQNVYMPMLIPESLLQKEKDHVEGFAPECAWVTYGGSDPLEERYQIQFYQPILVRFNRLAKRSLSFCISVFTGCTTFLGFVIR